MNVITQFLWPLRKINQNMFSGHYNEWRAKRIASIINYYNPNFFLGKSLLEVGCGLADIGGVFSKLGASVTCSDVRSEYLREVKFRYPEIKTVKANLEIDYPF